MSKTQDSANRNPTNRFGARGVNARHRLLGLIRQNWLAAIVDAVFIVWEVWLFLIPSSSPLGLHGRLGILVFVTGLILIGLLSNFRIEIGQNRYPLEYTFDAENRVRPVNENARRLVFGKYNTVLGAKVAVWFTVIVLILREL